MEEKLEKRIHFRISEEDYNELKSIAKEHGVKASILIRRAIKKFIEEYSEKSRNEKFDFYRDVLLRK